MEKWCGWNITIKFVLDIILQQKLGWLCVPKWLIPSQQKRSLYNFIWLFLIHLICTRFSDTMVCILDFLIVERFCDFHILFVYQSSYIPTTYQNFWCIAVLYQTEKTAFFIFAVVRYFLVDTSGDMVIITESMCIKVCNFSCKRHLYMYILYSHWYTIYIFTEFCWLHVLKWNYTK